MNHFYVVVNENKEFLRKELATKKGIWTKILPDALIVRRKIEADYHASLHSGKTVKMMAFQEKEKLTIEVAGGVAYVTGNLPYELIDFD